jgi:hypothetical protein
VADEELKDEEQRCNGVDREQQKGLERYEGVTGVLVKISVLLSLCPPQIPHESPWDRELTLITMMLRILIFCCPRECRIRGVNLAAHLHLVSRLRTSGAIIRLSHIFMTYRRSSFPVLGCSFNNKTYKQGGMYRKVLLNLQMYLRTPRTLW